MTREPPLLKWWEHVTIGIFIAGFFIDNTATIRTEFDRELAYSTDDLINSSDYIVEGYFKNSQPIEWNMARNTSNIQEEDKNNYIKGHVYDFKIKKVIRGNIEEENIPINLTYSYQFNTQSNNDIILDEFYEKPETEKEVVLFLKKDADLYGYYYPATNPYKYVATKSGYKISLPKQIKNSYNFINETFSFNGLKVEFKNDSLNLINK